MTEVSRFPYGIHCTAIDDTGLDLETDTDQIMLFLAFVLGKAGHDLTDAIDEVEQYENGAGEYCLTITTKWDLTEAEDKTLRTACLDMGYRGEIEFKVHTEVAG